MAKKQKKPEPYLRCGSTCKDEYEQLYGNKGICKRLPQNKSAIDSERSIVHWGWVCQFKKPNPDLEDHAQTSA